VKTRKSCHITAILRSLHWLKITERIVYKLLSLTYKVLTTTQPPYLRNLISVQRPRSTRSSSVDRSFRYASPCLWNQLFLSLRQPHSGTSSSISDSCHIDRSVFYSPPSPPSLLLHTHHTVQITWYSTMFLLYCITTLFIVFLFYHCKFCCILLWHMYRPRLLYTFSNSAVQLFSCKYVTIKLSWVGLSWVELSSSITSCSSDSPLSTSVTPSLFHSWLKTYLFHKC